MPLLYIYKNPERIFCFADSFWIFAYFNKTSVWGSHYAVSFTGNRWLPVRSFWIFACNLLRLYPRLSISISSFPLVFRGVEIFEIHNHFLEPQMLLPLGSSGSSDIESLFRSGYFHKIPGASLKNFWKCTGACSLLHECISLNADNRYSLHIHTPLLLIHIRSYFSAFL